MKTVSLLLILAVVIIGLAIIGPVGCTRPDAARRVLSAQGYTQIEITGWRPMMAGEDEAFSTGFRAKAPNGSTVTGAVTSGVMKGNTIRLD